MLQYKKLLAEVVQYGTPKGDRTGTGTLSLFGGEMRFDLSQGFPLVTTKKVFWKGVVEELLWMLSGDTNIARLQAAGVRIWDEWADEKGDLGPVYGAQWRSWLRDDGETIDQLAKVVQRIKVNPDCRRLIVTAWNPGELDEMALAPCHCLFQFNTRPMTLEERWKRVANPADADRFRRMSEENATRLLDGIGAPSRYLDLRLDQRSADVFLGVPFNIASYSLLLLMVAQATGTAPGHFIHQFGDVHLYKNHIEQAKLQLSRETWGLPQVQLNPEVTDLFAFTAADISLLNYRSHDAISAPVAV